MTIFSRKRFNFYHLCLIFLKIIGVAPVLCHSDTNLASPFQISSRSRCYNLIYLTTYTWVHLYFATHHLISEFPRNAFFLALEIFFFFITFMVVFTTVLTLILRQETAVDICNKLHEINQLLKVFDKNYWQKKIDTRLKLLVTLNVVFCLVFPIRWAFSPHLKIYSWFLEINSMLVSWIILEFVGLVVLMGSMAETINEQLESSCINSKITIEVNSGRTRFSTKYAKIGTLQELYLKLVKTAVKYTDFYNFIILFCIAQIYATMLNDIFATIRHAVMMETSVHKNFTSMFHLRDALWDITLLISVTFSVTKLSSEVGRII